MLTTETTCPDNQVALKQDSTNLLYINSVSGILVTFIVAATIALYYLSPETQSFKFSWLLAMSFVCLLRLFDLLYWHNEYHVGISD